MLEAWANPKAYFIIIKGVPPLSFEALPRQTVASRAADEDRLPEQTRAPSNPRVPLTARTP